MGQTSPSMRQALVLASLVASGLAGFGCTSGSGGESNPSDPGTGGESGTGGGGGPTAGSSGASGGSTGGSGGASGSSSGGASGASGGLAGGSGGASGSSSGAGGSGEGGASGGAAGVAGGGAGTGGSGGGGGGASTLPAVLVFSKTAGFRHDSIPDGIGALTRLASDNGWQIQFTEDANVFSDQGLAPFNVLVFLMTTGDVFAAAQEAAFERFIRAGGGFVGIHSATDTEFDWPFYGALVGAYFREHPAVQQATIRVEDATHPSTRALPNPWRRTDEWYAFEANPRPNVTVLLSLDESSYMPGTSAMGGDHPIAWFHTYEGGRAFQTSLGHTRESYTEPAFIAHIAGGIEWAARR